MTDAESKCPRYPGNYERFLELKEERMSAEGAARDSARNKMRGELAWMRKQPKARQAKSKARQERFFELKAKVGPHKSDGGTAVIAFVPPLQSSDAFRRTRSAACVFFGINKNDGSVVFFFFLS